jgi:hypothetical protein
MNTPRPQITRGILPLCQKILDSPYFLALLAGLWPIAFYTSHNWFMFEPSRIPLIVGTVSFIIWLALSLFYVVLSQLWRMFFDNNESKAVLRLFVFVSILVMAYLLRRTFLPLASIQSGSGNPNVRLVVFVVLVMVIASTVAWFIPRVQIFRLNVVLAVMSIPILGMGLKSIISTQSSPTLFPRAETGSNAQEDARQAIYAQVRFSKRPNVYYIVPDGYPNAEASKTIFSLDATDFHGHLELSGFTIYPSTFSNYADTMAAMSSLLGTDHHYYRRTVGNLELLGARRFIVSAESPVGKSFRNNGYQIHYIHQSGFLFSSGCFVDSCWPMPFWGTDEFMDVLVSRRLRSKLLPARVSEPITATGGVPKDEQTPSESFIQRTLEHVDSMSERQIPHFTYVHLDLPGHSLPGPQTREQLASFRKDYGRDIQRANAEILKIVSHILTRDPNALIIVNADHGAWGYGNILYLEKELFLDTTDYLKGLDHLGALLAIRWPDAANRYDQGLRTNVNLFSHIVSYLSESNDVLATKVPDDGFLWMEVGGRKKVWQVMKEGRILEHMVEVDSMSGRPLASDDRRLGGQ